MRVRDFHTGRSAVYADGGVAATAHPLATLTAIDVLRSGGNAVDAALAAIALLCVIEPHATGIGGDCFVLYSPKAGMPIGLNGSGRAPKAATYDWYKSQGIDAIKMQSPHAVTVPGAVDAWCKLHADHGSKDLAELLAPAIDAAENGYRISPRTGNDWGKLTAKMSKDPDAAKRFLPGGKPPAIGDLHKQPELAETLKKIAKGGRDAFYKGDVAKDIVDKLRSVGGLHTMEDFEESRADYVTPISTRYRGYEVHEIPPNGQGITALIMLNVLAGFDYGSTKFSQADRIHLMAEAAKFAYRLRNQHVADMAHAEVPVDRLLSTQEAASIRSQISLSGVSPWTELDFLEHKDTTYLCVVDKDRNACSFINSLFAAFGSGILAPRSGVMLQNRGQGFRVKEGHPNCIGPRKRPMHTIIPGMLTKNGRAVMPFGVMGGHFQPTGHSTLVTNMVDLDMDPQDALAAPRMWAYEGELKLEPAIPEGVAEDLARRGHKVVRTETPPGGGQAIWIDHDRGVLIGGSEPRKDGCALGY
jgi:gamma-glutamyltranspeptidase/glutathione hydrolase